MKFEMVEWLLNEAILNFQPGQNGQQAVKTEAVTFMLRLGIVMIGWLMAIRCGFTAAAG